MAIIKYKLCDGRITEVAVSAAFAKQYHEMEHRDGLIERKETRRHQSLDKSIEHGFEVPDVRENIQEMAEKNEDKVHLHNALKHLTDRQKSVLILYAVHNFSFRQIGDKLCISKETAREHFTSAVKKMKKLLENTLSNSVFRGY